MKIFERYLFRITLDTYYIIKRRGDFYDSFIWSSTGPISIVLFYDSYAWVFCEQISQQMKNL